MPDWEDCGFREAPSACRAEYNANAAQGSLAVALQGVCQFLYGSVSHYLLPLFIHIQSPVLYRLEGGVKGHS